MTNADIKLADTATRTQHLDHWLKLNDFRFDKEADSFKVTAKGGLWNNWTVEVWSSAGAKGGKAPIYGETIFVTAESPTGRNCLTVMFQYSETLPDDNGQNRASGYWFDHECVAITDAFTSTCSRFTVNPEEYYGMPKVVAQLLTNLNDIARNVTRFGRNYEATQKDRKSRQRAIRAAVKEDPMVEFPESSLSDWQAAVVTGETRLGYVDWAIYRAGRGKA